MKLSRITNQLSSQRLIAAAIKYMLWQRLSTMQATFPRLARAEMNAHKSAKAQAVVKSFETTRSEFWAIFARAESRGVEYDIQEELDRLTTTPKKPMATEQINKLAEATGLPSTTIAANMEANRQKALGQSLENRKALEDTLYEGEFSEDAGDYEVDPDCKADQLDAQAEKLVLWLATWNKPDWAELMLIKNDRELLAKLSAVEENEDTNNGIDEECEAGNRGELRAVYLANKEAA